MSDKFPPFALQYIVFDLDGVLVDSEALHARAKVETLVHFGLNISPQDYEQYKGRTDEFFFRSIREQHPSWQADLQSLIAYKTEIFIDLYPELKPIPGAVDFIQKAIAMKIPLAVVTSATALSQKFAFKLLGIEDAISVVVNESHVSRHKPHPEPYLLAISKIDAAAALSLPGPSSLKTQDDEKARSGVIVIEDSPSGIQSAKGAGLFVVGLETSFPRVDLEQAGADICVRSYDQLQQTLQWS